MWGNRYYCTTTIVAILIQVSQLNSVFAQQQEQQRNINAINLYEMGKMVLGNNAKHLVILIPNEGHHGPGEGDEARFIGQPFVPQNAVVSPGTQIIWYNGGCRACTQYCSKRC
jgi:hypothetical protein